MRIHAYLTFDGDCEEAMTFYKGVLGGEITAMMPFEGTCAAEHVPAAWRSKIMHAALAVGGDILMASDGMPGKHETPQGLSVSLQIDDPADAERIFGDLSGGGTIVMPMEETFWARRFGMLIDRFGTPWMVNCSKPD